jgi:predicted KAP-like P-loop ATPase
MPLTDGVRSGSTMEDEPKGKSDVQSSSPLTDSKKDRLRREPFVLNLAAIIGEYSSEKSITFGLYGKWGSGKTTLLNFLIEELEKNDNLIVARFNPWNFADEHKLLKAFLHSFSAMLGKDDESEDLKTAAKYIEALAAVTEPVKPVSGLFGMWTRSAKEKAEKLDEVENIKDRVSEFLKKSKKRIVILIDDLDRLTEQEIRQMFQLVKAGADFDNVIYVLAFDRSIVAPALNGISNGDGERYLEKVVNVPLNVPAMTERQSREILFEELNAYSERHPKYNWANERLRSILDVTPVHFRTIRLIKLLMNLLIVVDPLVKDEVDFADHIAITTLKVLEPKIHDFLSENPRIFVDVLRDQFGRDDAADEADRKKVEDMLTERIRSMDRDEVLSVLSIVFPKIERLYAKNKSKE